MLTAVYSLGRVNGAEVWLAGWLICAAAFFLVGFLRKENRNAVEFVRRMSGLLAVGALVDIAWFFYFYPDGEYTNPGIVGAYVLLLWPLALTVTAWILKLWKK